MSKSKYGQLLIAAIALMAACCPSSAQPVGGVKVGVLTCRTSASLGLLLGSHQKIRCTFRPDNGATPDHYEGHINRLGVDIGIKTGGVMVWGVFAPTHGFHHGALTGKYVGASGSASFGLGLGANALVGGSHRSIALQPLSVEAQSGINLAVGVAGLTLRWVH
jgi:Protein of unknown function (DUF992)